MEKFITGLLETGYNKLPGYKIDPFEIWDRVGEISGEIIKHPRDTYKVDEFILDIVADDFIDSERNRLTLTGIVLGIPGGPISVGSSGVDIEEYVRTLFRISQALGYIYGILPNPLIDDFNFKHGNFIVAEILKIMALGIGMGGVSVAFVEGAKKLAEKEAKDIMRKRISDKLITKLAKEIANHLGMKLTKSTISKSVLKFVPILGGLASGFMTYLSVEKLGKSFKTEIKKRRQEYKSYMIRKGLIPPIE